MEALASLWSFLEFVLNTCSTNSNLKNPRVESFKIAAHFRKQKTEKKRKPFSRLFEQKYFVFVL